jgi:hypothetical protein
MITILALRNPKLVKQSGILHPANHHINTLVFGDTGIKNIFNIGLRQKILTCQNRIPLIPLAYRILVCFHV